MHRRDFLASWPLTAAALQAAALPAKAGELTGKIRKSLKWGMVQQAGEVSLVEAFRRLKELGFDGVEPSLTQVDDADVERWLAASHETGLVIDGLVGGRVGNLEHGLSLTRRLGGDSLLVVVPYDHAKSLPAQWDAARDGLKDAAGLAERAGIRLLVENVWASFLISPFDMARFIDEVDSPWVQVHLDLGNMVRWGVAEHWVDVLGPRSIKLDIKEFSLEVAMNQGLRQGFDVPLGEGSIRWEAVRRGLLQVGFEGWAAAEIRGGDWERLADISRRMDRVLDL